MSSNDPAANVPIIGNFIKRPIVVHAEQFIEGVHVPEGVVWHEAPTPTGQYLNGWWIETRKGWMRVHDRSLIMTGAEGEKWAIQESIFLKTYEPVVLPDTYLPKDNSC